MRPQIRFNRNELAGAFGAIGTDLPLIMGMIIAGQLGAADVLIMFGLAQIITGVWYRLPMAVQPLKVMAALVIANHIPGPILYAGGLAVGIMVFILTVTGMLGRVARLVPKAVVRGIQMGLGLKLALIATADFIPREGAGGYVLAAVAFCLVIIFMNNRRWPASLVVIALGAIFAIMSGRMNGLSPVINFTLPAIHPMNWSDFLTGFLVLALPQLPLSLGNSILATAQLSNDLYPERNITVRRIGFSYSFLNMVSSFFGGIPVCHGSGGLAGHYAFGGRTGGSVIIYGLMYLIMGLLFSGNFIHFVQIFPFPILGVILFFEGLALMMLIRDLAENREDFMIALTVGILANALPFGFLVGLVVGTGVYYVCQWMSSWGKYD